ncbi:PrsW family intramembrane metalloprotease [Streptomyces sp. NA02950]|uniref:PrsW family intramembrane metalloprotease n=1 Tax=Streptomyces sp. NA02950 TaxID=2742137 RepID=UPI0015922739|nr:PrsW family intramembrane metalloprotease [Streptomyces sp. NA02950]QKV93518.1 PrsW family intramembrane metalloprotease [Streptomyces sp. NA02950]
MHQSPPPQQPPEPPPAAPADRPYDPAYDAAYGRQPWFDGANAPEGWPHPPRRGLWGRHGRLGSLWDNKSLRATALVLLLSVSGLVILALVREQTGTKGFLVGLGLAVLPVPLIVAAFRWVDRVEPKPWRNLLFAFAWGACAATLVALIANGFATEWLMTTIDSSSASRRADADTWGATLVAPFVEESAKAAAVLLLFLFRRRDFNGIADGVVVAGITATGFAFTENILYLGSAFVSDQEFGYSGIRSTTAATFFIRGVVSPFAHPLFTAMTGVGFGIAAAAARHQRARRVLVPIAALLAAMVLHGVWNGSATLGGYGFITVYALFMVPVFGLLTWLTIWSRGKELRAVREQLCAYQAAGWLTPPEPVALGSMRARGIARDLARRTRGAAAARTVAEYTAVATSLAFLRRRAHRGTAGPEFTAQERELLDRLWERREVAQPALAHAALTVPIRRPRPVPRPVPGAVPAPFWPAAPYGGHGAAGYGAAGYGYGYGYGGPPAYGGQGPYGAQPGGQPAYGGQTPYPGQPPYGGRTPPGAPQAAGPPYVPQARPTRSVPYGSGGPQSHV